MATYCSYQFRWLHVAAVIASNDINIASFAIAIVSDIIAVAIARVPTIITIESIDIGITSIATPY